jgi:hypothetical protein
MLLKQDGAPTGLVLDGAKEETQGEFCRKAREADIHCRETEPHSPFQNRAEGCIHEIKRATGRAMLKSKAPTKLWDYCAELKARIRSHTAHDLSVLEDEVPETLMTGSTTNIYDLCKFGWYDWVYFWDTSVSFPNNKETLRRYLGPAPDIGSVMAARILKENGEVVVCTMLRPLLQEEILREKEKEERIRFDKAIYARWGPASKPGDFEDDMDIETPTYEPYDDDEDKTTPHTVLEADKHEDPDKYDKYLNSEVTLPRGDSTTAGRVVSRKRDHNGKPVGRSNSKPLLDTCTYFVEFPDGTETKYTANIITESMYAQADIDGNQYLLLSKIINHKSDGNAVHIDNSHFTTATGRKKTMRTTKGWKFCVTWKDESTTWEDLKDLKESNPVQVAEYVVSNKLISQPAFAWWVPFTLKKRDRIVAKVNSRYLKRTQKFGIEVPKSVEHAL